MAAALSPDQVAAYQNKISSINYGRDSEMAANAYGRFLSQQRQSRNLYDANRAYGYQRTGMQQAMNRRGAGALHSGVWRANLQKAIQDRYLQAQRMNEDYANQQRQYDLTDQSIYAKYGQQEADANIERANAIAQLAAMLGRQ